MTAFNELQKDIWMRQKRSAMANMTCSSDCAWLLEEYNCISPCGCMYIKKEVNDGKHNTLYTLA